MYMLDTNTVSYFVRKNPNVAQKLRDIGPDNICISSVTAAELLYGVARYKNKQLESVVQYFMESVTIVEWNYQVAKYYGSLRAEMESRGQIMSPLDLMIAAHAASYENCILVTNDKAFSMVPRLKLENWMAVYQ